MLPCILYEDEHLLAVNKPAGLNTHAPSPYAAEGVFDWLRHREPRWANLAIIHRLDKETSGVILFSKSTLANRSLTEQFTRREVRKKYLFVADRPVPSQACVVKSCLVRAGDRYVSRPLHPGGDTAETRFSLAGSAAVPGIGRGGCTLVQAEPLTGRTHQIRVHAADQGFPILGDTLYGGTPAARVYLHAAELELRHPETGQRVRLAAPPEFEAEPRRQIRGLVIDPESTDAYRLIHGASDGWPGWYVDRLGDFLFSQSEATLPEAQRAHLERLSQGCSARGAYHRPWLRAVGRAGPGEIAAQLLSGTSAPERFVVRENGLRFELSFAEGYSVGLFLDQRDNRRRFLTQHVAADFPLVQSPPGPARIEVLNTFAYTCGFSVCAAKAGARATSLDASKKYLEWGKRNFVLNGLDPAQHDFIYGDVFEWLRRLARKGRTFDVIVLDPPTFSQSKQSGVFRVTKDYGRLVQAALRLLRPGGVLFVSTNAAEWAAADFLASVNQAVRAANRDVRQLQFFPQPLDFPVSRAEPAYLKTVWLRVS